MYLRRPLALINRSSIALRNRRVPFIWSGSLSLLLSALALAQSSRIDTRSLEPPPDSHVRVGQMLAQIPDAPGDEGAGGPDEEPRWLDIWPAPAAVPTKRGPTAAEIVDLMHKAMAKTPTSQQTPTHGRPRRKPTPSIVTPPGE
jgi:hypothetical protein